MAENTNTNQNPDTSPAADSAENNEQTNSAENTAQKKYSDDEVNSLVKKNSEKAVQKLMKELGITDKEKAKGILRKAAEEEKKTAEKNGGDDGSALKSELEKAKHSHELAVLENVFLTSDVQPSKVEKAVRLIDVEKCRDEDGNFDREKAKAEVEALLKEWPELKKTAENSGGFVIGSDGQSDTGGKGAAKSKPAVKQKSWNRWN